MRCSAGQLTWVSGGSSLLSARESTRTHVDRECAHRRLARVRRRSHRALAILTPSSLALCTLLVACGINRTSYPLGSVVEFKIQCAQNLWPGSPTASLDLREAFCACLVRRSEERYDLDEFDRIRVALHRAGYRSDAAGVPPEFVRLVDECRADLDRGTLPVK